MKKTFFALILQLIALVSVGQYFVGKTIEEVKTAVSAELKMTKTQIETNDAGVLTMNAEDEFMSIKYVFNSEKKCSIAMIQPLTQEVKDFLLNDLNQNGTKLKSEKWANLWLYQEGGTNILVFYTADKDLGYFKAQKSK